ncbi:MAG: hypothetical protein MJ123_02405 [Lachnospiraceae bacterium]|nr:hypothetical protein [Lachnospiraceae bacterium]
MSGKLKKQVDLQVILMIVVVIFMFGVAFFWIGYSIHIRLFGREFTRQVGINLTGQVTVYAKTNGDIYLLDKDTVNNIAKASVIGFVNEKSRKDKVTGKSITLITKAPDQVDRSMTIEELTNGKLLITIENENGKIQSVTEETKYFWFEDRIAKNDKSVKVTVIPSK